MVAKDLLKKSHHRSKQNDRDGVHLASTMVSDTKIILSAGSALFP
jgi:hypothetical protein